MSIYADCLYPWQRSIVDKFRDRRSFGLFLDMGTGKTPISLAFAEANGCEKLVIVTLNAKVREKDGTPGSWYEWLAKSSVGYERVWRKDKGEGKYDPDVPEAIVTNYENTFSRTDGYGTQLKPYLVSFARSCRGKRVALILDESHKAKTRSSKQSTAIAKLQTLLRSEAADCYTYLLSGTPFTTGYIDLYNQLRLLGCPMTKKEFEDRFCVRGHIYGLLDWQQPIVGYKNIDGIYDLVHKYAITIKSEEVSDLPPQIFYRIEMPLTSDFRLYTLERAPGGEIAAKMSFRGLPGASGYDVGHKMNNPFFRDIDWPRSRWLADTPANMWLRARQLSVGFQGNAEDAEWYDETRLNELRLFLSENRENYVIFYNYTPEFYRIFSICDDLGYKIDVYNGEIHSLENYAEYDRLLKAGRSDGAFRVIIANFASGSTGMNWQDYSHCILFSLPLYKDYAQALKRVHRTGQRSTVLYYMFYQRNWLDQSMMKALAERKDYNDRMFEGDLALAQEGTQ